MEQIDADLFWFHPRSIYAFFLVDKKIQSF
jgi:hypothetical protein